VIDRKTFMAELIGLKVDLLRCAGAVLALSDPLFGETRRQAAGDVEGDRPGAGQGGRALRPGGSPTGLLLADEVIE
jgi:hypothetical protein